jgi:hypothetical protein
VYTALKNTQHSQLIHLYISYFETVEGFANGALSIPLDKIKWCDCLQSTVDSRNTFFLLYLYTLKSNSTTIVGYRVGSRAGPY